MFKRSNFEDISKKSASDVWKHMLKGITMCRSYIKKLHGNSKIIVQSDGAAQKLPLEQVERL